MKTAKTLGAAGALIAAALVGGTLINSAFAADPTAKPDPAQAGQYCQSFRTHLADKLGTDVPALTSAMRSAAEATVDEAVAKGDLTKEQADAIKSRIANADMDGCFGLGRKLLHPGHPAVRLDLGAAAAGALGMQPSDLAKALRSGKSLKDVAKDQKVDYDTVTKAVLNAAKSDLDKAVATGKLSAEREQAMLDRLDRALQSGKLPGGAHGRGLGPGQGSRAVPGSAS